MKITLIEPAMIKTPHFSEKSAFKLQPLTLAALAGITPPHVEVRAIDDRLEKIDYDDPCELVGISVRTFTARRSYQIAAEYRKRGVPVILGGYHPTLLPEEAAPRADSILIGEAEEVWADIVRDAEQGRLQPVYQAAGAPRFAGLRYDRSIFAEKRYLPVEMVEASRGCPHSCSFCAVSAFHRRTHRCRPADEVAAEVAALQRKLVLFTDDSPTGNKDAARTLFQALIPLKIRWMAQVSISVAEDRDMVRLMSESGCVGVLVGIESLNPAGLRQINKTWNVLHRGYEEKLGVLRDHGIAVIGSFILGMDDETPETLERTLEFAIRQRLFAALFNLLIPYPGTRFYEEMRREGRLCRPEWWLDPTYTYGSVVVRPHQMAAEELEQERLAMGRTFYGLRSIIRRFAEPRSNLSDLWHALAFLSLNLPADREERRRFGQALGANPEE
jgi:radical SAM superfamily enzyme YgiQ (UPF0313 family)